MVQNAKSQEEKDKVRKMQKDEKDKQLNQYKEEYVDFV